VKKLDIKDRKILYHLDLDSRQSFRSIGRKIGLSKDIVASRVKKLQELGIIKNFRTRINLTPLGYNIVRNYYVFQNINPRIRKEIIHFFTSSKITMAVISLEGSYDLLVITQAKNMLKIKSFFDQFLIKYRDYILKQALSIYLKASWFDLSFLLYEKGEVKETIKIVDERTFPENNDKIKEINIDDLDYKILRNLAINSRIPSTELAKKVNSTITIIHHRIKKLLKSNIIEGFGVGIDLRKLGYRFYHVDVTLKDLSKRANIISYICKNPNMICIEEAIGHSSDLELEFFLKNTEILHEIMDNLTMKFPNCIKTYNFFNYLDIYKSIYM
jgi:DNA-binding Lrp family transcriptional regulator